MTVVRPNSIAGINSITVQTGQALNIHDASGNLIRSLTNSSGISTFASINVTQGSGDLIVGISTLVVDNSAGKIGIGTVPARTLQVFAATPQVNLKSAAGGNCELQFGDTGDEVRANIIYNSTDNYLGINGYNNTERLRINSSGQVLIGGTSSVNGWGQTNRLQVHGSTWDTSGVTIAKLGGNSNSPNLVFTASRGSSVGTVVQNGDRLGYITFTGDDGTDVNSNAAKIYCEVDGSPGSNDLPGRLIFSTTADGADSASERLRISSDGGVALTGHSECSINALGNSSGTVTIDFRTANYISCTLTGTTTFANPTTESIGQSGSIIITQDGTGSRTASWGSQFKWVGGTAPTLTTTAAAVDRIDYLVVAADTIHCVASLDVK